MFTHDGIKEVRGKAEPKGQQLRYGLSSTKDEDQQEVTCFDKCVTKNLLAEETMLEMAVSQEHLCSWYPKCVEGADVTEYTTENLAQFLMMRRRAVVVHRRPSEAQKNAECWGTPK